MTLGEKIKKFRTLNDLTQKELGIEVGFSAVTADSRIRKYESDLMAPKKDIKDKLIAALDIDDSALSETDISSAEDVIHLFFELEENFGMEVDKRNGKIYLSFDDSNNKIRTLITYLNLWQTQKSIMLPDAKNSTASELTEYEKWKSRFSLNVNEYFMSKETELNNYYAALIDDSAKEDNYATKTSEITVLLREMYEAGLTISTAYLNAFNINAGPGFTFIVNQLLDPPTPSAKQLFARFLSELNHFTQLGADIHKDFQISDNELTITYCIPVTSFSIIKLQIDKFLEYIKSGKNENDFSRYDFERSFQADLETNFNYIEDEIKMSCS